MTSPELVVFKGKKSQTGLAFLEEFPGVSFLELPYTFKEIQARMSQPQRAVIPIWNSHEGEITLSNAYSMIFEEEARLYYLWPKYIQFQCLVREIKHAGKKDVISVKVAKTQCSEYIAKNNLVFIDGGDTTSSFKKFKDDESISAVLVPPGMDENNEFKVACDKAENPINFTTFSLLGSPDSVSWSEDAWDHLYNKTNPRSRVFVAIEMNYTDSLSEAQEELLNRLIDDAKKIEDIPKVIFVAKHNETKCRILIEAANEFAPNNILDEMGPHTEIKILPNAGHSAFVYSDRANKFLESYIGTKSADFIKHKGTQTCFFSCPALGIVTHGFDFDATEMVVYQMIKKYFDLLDSLGTTDKPSPAEALYTKYKDRYLDEGISCIVFTEVK